MIIYPAIDLFGGKAVRLFKGDYAQMTVYSDCPSEIALDFKNKGATHIHIVDLEGAKSGSTPNIETVKNIISASGLFAQIGGGIRSMETVERYISIGASRVILGTSAVKDEGFLKEAVQCFGDKIAVGVDIKDGKVAIKGWTEKTALDCFDFCEKLQGIGVKTVISTDISLDGAMKGTNHGLYESLSKGFNMNFIASGGVSSVSDVERLAKLNLHGAIIGKAYYTGAIDLKEAIEVAK